MTSRLTRPDRLYAGRCVLGPDRSRRARPGRLQTGGRSFAAAAVTLIMVVSASVLSGCASAKSPIRTSSSTSAAAVTAAGKSISIDVSKSKALSVRVPDVGTIAGAAGSFRRSGSITITPETATFKPSGPIRSAGTGVEVTMRGTTLVKPLHVTFKANAGHAGEVPIVAHRADNGTWDYMTATRRGRSFAVRTSHFSLNVPAWLNVANWLHELGSLIASGVGGRTSPLTCTGAPSWFEYGRGYTDQVHVCAKDNPAADGTDRAELQIKSNRGQSLQVPIVGNPDYVWVEDQSDQARALLGTREGYDPTREVILPAGSTMTLGYLQPGTDENFTFDITATSGPALVDTLIRYLLEQLFGLATEGTSLFVPYFIASCSADFNVGPASDVQISVPTFTHLLSCIGNTVADQLDTPEKALPLVQQLGGNTADADMLVSRAEAVSDAAAIIKVIVPVTQLFGSDIDTLASDLTNGVAGEVTVSLTGKPGANAGTGGGSSTQPTTPPTTAQPAPDYHGGFAATVSQYATSGDSGHKGPGNQYAAGPTYPAGTTIPIYCYVNGQAITNSHYNDTTTVWDLSDDGYWYTDAWLFTNNNGPVVPACA